MDDEKRFVVCAAIAYGSRVIAGSRHFDKVMRNQIETMDAKFKPPTPSDWAQGFIDQNGVYMSRREAWDVAVQAGQIVRPEHALAGLEGPELCSEVLY